MIVLKINIPIKCTYINNSFFEKDMVTFTFLDLSILNLFVWQIQLTFCLIFILRSQLHFIL